IENPFVSLNMDNTSITLLAKPFVMSGAIMYDTDTLNLVAFEGNWFGFSMTDTTAEISLKDFSGKANTRLETKLLSNTITVPLKFNLASSASQNGKIPDVIGLEVVADGVTTSAFEGSKTLSFNLIKSPGRLDLMSNDDLGLVAYRLDDGEISVTMSDKSSVRFNMFGYVRDGQMQLAVSDTHIDMSKVSWIFNTNMFSMYKGIVTGSFGISGLISDPEFSGKLLVDNIELSSPSFVPYHASAPSVYANLDRNEISISESLFTFPKRGALDAAITLVLDRWKLDHVDVKLRSPEDDIIPVDVKIPFIHAKGGGKGNLDLTIRMDSVDITGDLYVEDTSVELVTSILQAIWLGSEAETVMPTTSLDGSANTSVKTPLDVRVAIGFTVGSHVQIYYNPLLRGLVEPNTKFSFAFDSATGSTEIEGDVSLRGGEVMYFNRNFYLKEGRIVFDKNSSLDPKLTVRAETRERDANNNLVIITLTALNQSVSNFTARLSASPAKSEAEIMNMLGQIVTADSGSAGQFAGSVLDYGMQMTVFRKFENTLRDLFNFDIFSIRVSAVQNAIAQSVNQKSTDNEYTVGNFFDNSSVYIGKYFGSSLYVDSLMRLSYDETKVADGTSSTGLIFQPEIGFELQAPFANIRWDIAPDVSTNQSLLLSSLWVQATSITLSWKIDF
nr:translocation/assembly module TamB [Treponema sp.]